MSSSSPKKPLVRCKPFTVLIDVQSQSSPMKASTSRRSTRIASRSNENELDGEDEPTSNGKARRMGQCSADDDDKSVVIARKRKTPNKRRNQNRIQSSDDEDDDFVTKTPKKRSPKIKKRQRNTPSNSEDVIEPKRKTPVKRQKPLLTIKCYKMTDYFKKSPTNGEEVPVPRISTSVTVTPPPEPDVIVLSSSEEHDDATEPVRVEITPSMPCNPQPPSKRNCPDYKIVDGTNFAVDAFRFGEIAGVTSYFLTHYHSDHYDGLNRKFNHQPIYMSTITGRLVRALLKVNGNLIRTMNINTKYVIDGVEVTAIDANHCPGAVMFTFKLPCGRTILHTGDFRATPEMESNPVFWNNNFSTIYLDTTYLHKSYNFCAQNEALLFVEDEIRKFQQKNVDKKFVIVVGSYMVGKERVWAHIAQTFNMKVWLEGERRKAFELIYTDENRNQAIKDCVCDARDEAQLHVIPIQCVNYAFLMDYVKNFKEHNLLAFRPTGWAQNTKPQYGSRVSIVGVQYSEHSSYRELERFVRFVQPEKVISTVPISSGNTKTRSIPSNWLSTAPKPMTTSQRTVTSYMQVRKSSSAVSGVKMCAMAATQNGTSQHEQRSQQLVRDDAGSYDSMETDYMP